MKITKNKQSAVNASTDTQELNNMIYSDAIGYIQDAISSLSAIVRRSQDPIAVEAINDLSVVLLDLNSSNNASNN